MWSKTFSGRLSQWTDLRVRVSSLPVDQCLEQVNAWWFNAPWSNFYLHWDDRNTWPDPWQLLHDNIYCSLARGLGVMYTITLLDRADLENAVLVEVGADNLVLIDGGQYVLNHSADQITGIYPDIVNTPRRITHQDIKTIFC